MKQYLFSRRSRSIGVGSAIAMAFAGLTAGPAAAGSITYSPWGSTDTSACSSPALSQPFLSIRDSNWYTLAPGQSYDSFTGTGWSLSGGASIKTVPLADQKSGSVLDLPSGSQAISPAMCVSSDYPTARTMVRNVIGAEGVHVYVSYAGAKTAYKPQNTGQVHGTQTAWTVSNPFNIHPGNLPGWHLVRFAFVPGGKSSDFQVYNFWVDPRMS